MIPCITTVTKRKDCGLISIVYNRKRGPAVLRVVTVLHACRTAPGITVWARPLTIPAARAATCGRCCKFALSFDVFFLLKSTRGYCATRVLYTRRPLFFVCSEFGTPLCRHVGGDTSTRFAPPPSIRNALGWPMPAR